MKKLFYLILMLFCSMLFAQSDEILIEKTVKDFFAAMYSANPAELKNTFSETIVFQTITKDGKVQTEDAQKLADGISKFVKGDLDEQINIKKIFTDGQLASVWMDYQFVFKGKVSHCGVNSFQLVKNDGKWKVQYIIDTRKPCAK